MLANWCNAGGGSHESLVHVLFNGKEDDGMRVHEGAHSPGFVSFVIEQDVHKQLV